MTVNMSLTSVRRISSLFRMFGSMFCAICWSSVTQTRVPQKPENLQMQDSLYQQPI